MDGVVHDSKRDQDQKAKNILDEFEAQFAQGGPQPTPPNVPETVQAAPSGNSSEHDSFAPPSGSVNRPQSSTPHQAPQPSRPAPQPMSRPVRSAPQSMPQPSRPAPQSSMPHPPSQPVRPSPRAMSQPTGSAPQPVREGPRPTFPIEPTDHASELDLPDFDLDFHPSAPSAPQPAPASQPTPPPSRPAPRSTESGASLDFEIPDPSDDSSEPDSFSLPDFSSPSPQPVRRTASAPEPSPKPAHPASWDDLDQPFDDDHRFPEPAPRPAPKPAPAPQKPAAPAREVFMRDGTLYIEKHALARQVHDVGELRGLSSSTGEQFARMDGLDNDEKKVLAKLKAAMQNVHDTLEQADALLFTGEN